MLRTVTLFATELRHAGVDVALPELADAVAALRCTPLDDRAAVRTALSATLLKHPEHTSTFDLLFDLFFAPVPTGGTVAAPGVADLDDRTLRTALAQALSAGDAALIRRIAAVAVERFAGFEPGRAVAGRLYVMRVSRGLGLDTLPEEVAADTTVGHDAAEERVQEFRRLVESRVRALLVADRGAVAVARTVRPTVPTAVDFMDATPEELAAIEGMAGPLAASLTARIRIHRKARSGRLDVRAMLRRSLSTGGVLSDLVFHPPRPPRVDLVVLADVSGSVSRFTSFTFTLLHAMGGAFPRLRCFAFLDGVLEVTDAVRRARTAAEAARLITADPRLVWLDGRSDYGHALRAFADEHRSAITANTVLLILGDARSNYQSPEADVLGGLRRRAREVHWLNPEPRRYWDSGDSVMARYAPHCASVRECRTVGQLQEFLEVLGGRGA